VDRVFFPKAIEIWPERIGTETLGPAVTNLVERNAVGVVGSLGQGRVYLIEHVSPLRSGTICAFSFVAQFGRAICGIEK
jgi:hypothetical protein